MRVVVFTLPMMIENEGQIIEALLENGVDRVHIRKPDSEVSTTRDLILSIDRSWWGRLTLHDHFELAVELNIGGVHLNRRNPQAPEGFRGMVSKSFHSISELMGCEQTLDYYTLSPIYDSISKEGYQSGFSTKELREAAQKGVIDSRAIALGGVTAAAIPQLENLGFGGVALLGAIWNDQSSEAAVKAAQKAIKMARMAENFALQFITHRNDKYDDITGAKAAIKGGCRWVQLRIKGASDPEFKAQAEKLKPLCEKEKAIFLINDRAHLVRECKADGVHLGKQDISPSQARELLGDKAIIGGTANSTKDIDHLVGEGVDYIGLGPFRFTTTKEKLSPTIGIEGYKKAVEHCAKKGYKVPIVAIGGITKEDIESIMECGVSGIALSGTILNAKNSEKETESIIKKLKKKE
ncbi:MAG: thiamine phosphate synthase [Rikenellaceae bacterium]